MLERGINSVSTTSMGRLFDGVAALLGLHPLAAFEGQAAMALETAAIQAHPTDDGYALPILCAEDGALILDWSLMIEQILVDHEQGANLGYISRKFHNTLVEGAVETVRHIGIEDVALSGGCFQNKLLTESLILRLRQAGFRPHWHRSVPPNDGGIALGQIVAKTSVA